MKTIVNLFKYQKFSVLFKNGNFKIGGPKGLLTTNLPAHGGIKSKGNSVFFCNKKDYRLWLTLIKNNIEAVLAGFMVRLHLQGIGYRAKVYTDTNQLFLKTEGQFFLTYCLPTTVFAKARKNKIILFSLDKTILYKTVQNLKNMQKPNPYTGKGVRVFGEVIL